MTWVDVAMYAFVAGLVGLAGGFKMGLSITRGSPGYEEGVRDGMNLERRLRGDG